MFSFHKPRVYRSTEGCCICRAKSSSSRFTDSRKYELDSMKCFDLKYPRHGEICNACVLLVKRYKRLPQGSNRHWGHVVDARAGPGTKSSIKHRRYSTCSATVQEHKVNVSNIFNPPTALAQTRPITKPLASFDDTGIGHSTYNKTHNTIQDQFAKMLNKNKTTLITTTTTKLPMTTETLNNFKNQNISLAAIDKLPTNKTFYEKETTFLKPFSPISLPNQQYKLRTTSAANGIVMPSTTVYKNKKEILINKNERSRTQTRLPCGASKRRKLSKPRRAASLCESEAEMSVSFFDDAEWQSRQTCCGMVYENEKLLGAIILDLANYQPCTQHRQLVEQTEHKLLPTEKTQINAKTNNVRVIEEKCLTTNTNKITKPSTQQAVATILTSTATTVGNNTLLSSVEAIASPKLLCKQTAANSNNGNMMAPPVAPLTPQSTNYLNNIRTPSPVRSKLQANNIHIPTPITSTATITTHTTTPTPVLKKHHLFFKRQSECFPHADLSVINNHNTTKTNITTNNNNSNNKGENAVNSLLTQNVNNEHATNIYPNSSTSISISLPVMTMNTSAITTTTSNNKKYNTQNTILINNNGSNCNTNNGSSIGSTTLTTMIKPINNNLQLTPVMVNARNTNSTNLNVQQNLGTTLPVPTLTHATITPHIGNNNHQQQQQQQQQSNNNLLTRHSTAKITISTTPTIVGSSVATSTSVVCNSNKGLVPPNNLPSPLSITAYHNTMNATSNTGVGGGYLQKIKNNNHNHNTNGLTVVSDLAAGKIMKHSLEKLNTTLAATTSLRTIKQNDAATTNKTYILAAPKTINNNNTIISPAITTNNNNSTTTNIHHYQPPPLTVATLTNSLVQSVNPSALATSSAGSSPSSTSSSSSTKFSDNSSDSGFDENMLDRKSASPLQEDTERKLLSRPGIQTMFLASGVQIQGQTQNLMLTGNEVAAKILQHRKQKIIQPTTSQQQHHAMMQNVCF